MRKEWNNTIYLKGDTIFKGSVGLFGCSVPEHAETWVEICKLLQSIGKLEDYLELFKDD